MRHRSANLAALLVLWTACCAQACSAQEKTGGDKKSGGDQAIAGLVPKAPEGLKLDGKLDEWEGAFATPVHVGNPNVTNRLSHVLFMWDDENLYVGLRCLDQKPNHSGSDKQLVNGDALSFYVDTRRGETFGSADYRPGTLHMFWTPFTGKELKPRLQVRDDIPAFKGVKLDGAEVAGATTPWGYTAEFRLPWANFPAFTPDVGEVIGIDCELCSSDGGVRVDRAFVYSSPVSGKSAATLGRVRLVDRLNAKDLEPLGRALLPLSLTKSANYEWLYGTVGISPTIESSVVKLEGRIVDGAGQARITAQGRRQIVADADGSGFALWWHRWELYNLPAGEYTVELAALDKEGNVITQRKHKLLHDGPGGGGGAAGSNGKSPAKEDDKPPPPKKSDDPAPKKTDEPAPKKTDEPAAKKTDEPAAKKKSDDPPAKKGKGDDAPAKKTEDPLPKKDDKPASSKKDDEPAPAKEGDKPSSSRTPEKKGDPDDLPKPEPKGLA